jgi:hypothetical protein
MAWARKLTVLASVVTLSGSPAVLSACLAVCLHDVRSMASRVTSSNQQSHAATADNEAVLAHRHHHGDVETTTAVSGQRARPDQSAPHLTPLCSSCCAGVELAFMTGPRAERTDLAALGVAPTAVLLRWFATAVSARTPSFSAPPVMPLPPITASIPLRI